MVSSNPRDTMLWTPRTQEITHGFSPREMINHDINANEDSDGLSHHGRESPEDGESRDQNDPKKRKERAVRELSPPIPHVSIRPEKIDDTLGRSPQFEQEQKMIEAGIGLDLNRNGIGLSNGFNAGSVRSEGPNIKFGGSSSLVPRMLGKAVKDGKCSNCGREVWMPDNPKLFCMMCEAGIEEKDSYSPDEFTDMIDELRHNRIKGIAVNDGFDPDWQAKNTSEDVFTHAWDSILKGRRKYKGRRMYDDEESDEDEKKSKAKRKRKKKREGKKKKKAAIGGRQIKSASKRRAAMKELDVDRGSKRQAFHPNKHSDALRNVGRSRNDAIPLRLRDPIAWERKKAYERNRRAVGSMPRGLSHHADTRGGMGTKGRSVLGGTKLPSVSRMGTSTSKFSRGATGDPLGSHDPLFSKASPNITRAEIMSMKRKIEKLLAKLNKLTKTTPELGNEGKVGAQVNSDTGSAPKGATKLNDEDEPYRAFVDMALGQEMGLIGKR